MAHGGEKASWHAALAASAAYVAMAHIGENHQKGIANDGNNGGSGIACWRRQRNGIKAKASKQNRRDISIGGVAATSRSVTRRRRHQIMAYGMASAKSMASIARHHQHKAKAWRMA